MADVGNKAVNDAAPNMQALMTEIAKALVDEPEAVQVEAIKEGVTVKRTCAWLSSGEKSTSQSPLSGEATSALIITGLKDHISAVLSDLIWAVYATGPVFFSIFGY